MQHSRHEDTEPIYAPRREPGVDQKDQVQAQQSQGQVNEDLRRVVPTELPEGTEEDGGER